MRQKQTVISRMEDIISYECNYASKFVRILVGEGVEDVNGNFVPRQEQNYECITLYNEDFDALMAANPSKQKPQGVFRKEDLWDFVDTIRPIIVNDRINGPGSR